jgi:hypothetical protein
MKELICGEPSLDGPQIFYQGQAGASGPMIVLFLRAGYIELRVGTGSADTLRLRSFTGSGVTAFDASVGAQLDSPLTETTGTATPTTGIGAVTSIKGAVDCGDQQSGTSTILVTGLSPMGQVGGAITAVKVTCTVTASGVFVGVSGLSTASATPVLLFVTGSTGLIQVGVETKSGGSFYSGKATGLVTLVAGGAHMAGDVIESVAAGATTSPYTLHVMGDATCGTTTRQ